MGYRRFVAIGIVVGLVGLVLVSCGLMTPQQQNEALQTVDEMLRNGSITQSQWQAMREAILSASTTNWWAAAAQTVCGGALAYFGVQVRRGPVATPEEKARRKAACSPRVSPTH